MKNNKTKVLMLGLVGIASIALLGATNASYGSGATTGVKPLINTSRVLHKVKIITPKKAVKKAVKKIVKKAAVKKIAIKEVEDSGTDLGGDK